MKGVDKNTIDQRVKEMLDLVKLPDIGLENQNNYLGGNNNV